MRHSSQLIDFPYAEPMKEKEEESVYYWWWRYLKKATGPINPDFGDVSGDDFYSWWSSPAPIDDGRKKAVLGREKWRSTYLFANPEKRWVFTRVKKPLPKDAYTDPTILILTVPLDEPSAYLIDRFKAIIDTFKEEHEPGERAARHSQARYPVFGQPNVTALKNTLAIYDYRIANPDKPLWEALMVLPQYKTNKIDTTLKSKYSVLASRYMKKAKILISNAAQGRFPDIN